MKRYIRCCYCGTILGEIRGLEEAPTSAYCISCYEHSKNDPSPAKILDELIGEVE